MSEIELACFHCKRRVLRKRGQVRGERTFCSQKCFGLDKRKWSPRAKKLRKAAYDVEYRKKNWTQISRKKAGEYKRNFDPEKARAHRARQKELHGENHHTEYCRRYFLDPKKKAAKVAYDLEYRSQEYGEFSECYQLYLQLSKTIRRLMPDKYERLKARGYYERENAQQRKRHAQISRW